MYQDFQERKRRGTGGSVLVTTDLLTIEWEMEK